MREILFRGKAINRIDGRYYRTNYKNGDWVYGLVTRLYDERFEELPAEMANEYGVSGIEVDYKTIGQYTGLTDCKGNKIFEGDILLVHTDFFDENFIIKIVWNEDECGFFAVTFDEDMHEYEEENLYEYNTYYRLEVIGNIYDNPESMETENEK